MSTRVEIYIEKVVLDGLPQIDSGRFSESLERELLRYLTSREVAGTFHRDGSIRQLDAGEIRVAAGQDSGRLGAQVADAVGGGLVR